MLQKGMTGRYSVKVTDENTAKAMKSGELEVFATPCMLAIMEKASTECIKAELSSDESSVGTLANISHISATPVGMNVTATSTLEEVDGRRLVFSVVAEDECGVIGKGVHERFIINKEKFMGKTNAKNNIKTGEDK